MENSTSEKFALLIKYEGDRTTTTNMYCIIYTLYINCSVQCTLYNIVQSFYKDIFFWSISKCFFKIVCSFYTQRLF